MQINLLNLVRHSLVQLTDGFTDDTQANLTHLAIKQQSMNLSDAFDNVLNSSISITGIVAIESGMNTFGILSDRLTILACKERLSINQDARKLASQQLSSLLTILFSCARGDPSILEKEQISNEDVFFRGPGDAFFTLITSNLGMWVNQDLLYTKKANNVKCSRLREYINFFATFNAERNKAISFLDHWYNIKVS